AFAGNRYDDEAARSQARNDMPVESGGTADVGVPARSGWRAVGTERDVVRVDEQRRSRLAHTVLAARHIKPGSRLVGDEHERGVRVENPDGEARDEVCRGAFVRSGGERVGGVEDR